MPDNAVVYFVSYYDYYQPEAYVPTTDTFIEKDASINEEVEKLRHAATAALLSRRDVVVVASVSCIYGIGSPEDYAGMAAFLQVGEDYDRDRLIRDLIEIQYDRNDYELSARQRSACAATCSTSSRPTRTIRCGSSSSATRSSPIAEVDQLTGEVLMTYKWLPVWPATHYVTAPDKLKQALETIAEGARAAPRRAEGRGKLLEAQRLEMRVNYDLEMLETMGFCSGIENYSRHLDGRSPGEPANTLIDYFPDDFLCVIDESHVTVPQIRGMHEGDRSRKLTLVEHGFRLPSALDNRPCVSTSSSSACRSSSTSRPRRATTNGSPSRWSSRSSVRPDWSTPRSSCGRSRARSTTSSTRSAMRVERDERVLVTTLTKKMSEDLTDYLFEQGLKVRYLHSDIGTLERVDILRDLRLGTFDCLVGINLLREGLDLPEVSLVAILDADKEGFLRNFRSLIQTDRPCGAQRFGTGHHVCGQRHRFDEAGHRRDRPPP
jgi:excinuclease ABC subunit B